MKITEQQRLTLTGFICPYCKTKAVEKEVQKDVYGYKKIMVCENCNAFIGIDETGKPLGRLASPSLRSLKSRALAELERLYDSEEEKKEALRALHQFLGVPAEFMSIHHFNEKTIGRIFSFCMTNRDKSGANIAWYKPGDECPEHRSIITGTSACRGCPAYLQDDGRYIWCDPDMSYGNLKDKGNGKNKGK